MIEERLKKAGISHFDDLIHEQPKDWLVKQFPGGGDYPVNVARLMRNLVWQMKGRIESGQAPPFKDLLRTYRYMYVKSTLARVDALAEETDQHEATPRIAREINT